MKVTGIAGHLGGVLLVLLSCGNAEAASKSRLSAFAYDSLGRLSKEVVEPFASHYCVVKTYGYHPQSGNRTSQVVRNCNGSYVSGTLNEAAAPTGDAVFETRTSSTTFDAQGRFPISSVNAISQTTAFTHDPDHGGVKSVTDANGLASSIDYDGYGRKKKELFPDGTFKDWSYTYCSGVNGGSAACPTYAQYIVQVTPSNGPWTKSYHDALDRVIRTETQGFDGTSLVRQDNAYNSRGYLWATTEPYYSTNTDPRTTYFEYYDGAGRLVTTRTPVDLITTTYSVVSGVSTTTTTNELGQSETRKTNSLGQLVSVKDAVGSELKYEYDPFGSVSKTIDPNGSSIVTTYDASGRKTVLNDPDMGTWNYYYNALGELVRQVDAKSQTTTLVYDRLGRMKQRSEPDLISNWYYDAYKNGSACSKGIGKLCEVETDNGYRRVNVYDDKGRPSSTTTYIGANTYVASKTYDTKSRVDTLTYPSGFGIKYGYTTIGFLNSIKDKSNTSITYWTLQTVDAQGRSMTEQYGNGVTTTTAYEPNTGLLKSIMAGTGNSIQNTAYTYDEIGNVKTRTDSTQGLTETFLYDDLNRLESATVNSSGAGVVTTVTAYNAIGNIKSRTSVGTYEYNATVGTRVLPHAVSKITQSDASRTQFLYDAHGNLTQQTFYNAAGTLESGKTRTVTYTSFNQPSLIQQASGGPTSPVAHLSYVCQARNCTFNAQASVPSNSAGSIVSYTWSGDGWGSGSGVQYQVTAPTLDDRNITLTVTDSAGKTASVTVLVNLEAGGALCNVIWSGSCVAQTGSSGPAPSPVGPAPLQLAFIYGPEHQRVRQTAPEGTTYYLHAGNGDSLFFEEINSEKRNYIVVGGKTIALVKGGVSGTPYYYHSDGLGSITALSLNGATVTERLSYDPFGKRRSPNGSADSNNVLKGVNTDRGFTGHEHLDEIGLIHMNGRIYNPAIARFMSADPLIQDGGSLQSYNRYSYTINNPLVYTDPSGYSWVGKQFKRFGREMKRWEQDFRHEVRRPNSLLGPGLRIAGGAASLLCTGAYAACAAATEAAISRAQGVTGSQLLKNSAIAGATAQSFKWAGDLEGGARFAAHAAIGCASSAAGGGSCGSGAASAFLGVVGSEYVGDNLVVATISGGIGAEITGGNFGDGAVTGAFGYLFNSCLHGTCDTGLEQLLYDWLPGYKFGTGIYNSYYGGEFTTWEIVDGMSIGLGAAGKGLNSAFSGGAQSVFWSGFKEEALTTAMTLGIPLESTLGGSVLQWAHHTAKIPVPARIWGWASATFARNATGSVTAVIRAQGPSWTNIEKPILRQRGIPINYVP